MTQTTDKSGIADFVLTPTAQARLGHRKHLVLFVRAQKPDVEEKLGGISTRRLVQDRFLLEEDAQDAVKVAKASDILR